MADDHEQDDSGIEVIVDAPRELLYGACPRTGPNHSCLADRSIDTSPAAPPSRITPRHHPPSSPIMPPDFNLLAGLPLTILPAPARTRLRSSPGPPDPVRGMQEVQQHAIRQGFCYEGVAVGAHGLLASLPAAEPTPALGGSTCATITNSATAPDPDLDLDLDFTMDLGDAPAEYEDADTHPVVVGDVMPPHLSPPLLRTAGTHGHPDGPVLGLVIPEPDANFDLASPNRGGEGWIDWLTGNVFGGAGASTDKGVGEQARRRCVRGFGGVLPSRATDDDEEEEEEEEEEDVMGTGNDDFPASPESVAAAAGSRMQTKSWRKALADEVEVRHDDDNDDESDYDGGPRAHVIPAPVFTDACRKKRTPASSSLGVLPGTSQMSALTKQRPTKTTTTTDAPVFDASWSATAVFTVPGEPLGSAFLHVNKACIPDTRTRAETAAIARTPAYVIGKPRKTWGRLVSLRETDRRRRPTSLTPLGDNDDGGEDGNLDEDGDADADDGIWPGEYVVPVQAAQAEEMARITPEVERAIGAAFAIGGSASSSSSSSS
ncbi:hypothetical protein EDB83DRAFT_2518349 [Lactarius deliciosus]|nr:hypothetical protein EDB83DRAFT_2518349 [Lactarius deliciosus]